MDLRRQHEFWTPPPLWTRETAFILAGGPGLTPEIARRVRGRGRAIAVNSSASIAPWADILFFTDTGWLDMHDHRRVVEEWPGLVVTMSRRAKGELPDRVLRLREEVRPDFPPPGSNHIRHGRSSGHRAVSLSVALRAELAVLLGFDMRIVGRREHHHEEYAGLSRDLRIYEDQFIPSFAGWYVQALIAGTRIVNATPGSALGEFPHVALDGILA